jgi:dethiobiotin synthase
MGKTLKDMKKHSHLMCPYHFSLPASPHLACRLENKPVRKEEIKKSFKTLKKEFDFVIVESTGGVLVPLSKSLLMIDVAKEMTLPVILVAANKVGAVNHTLLAVEALKKRKITILGIIFNNCEKGVDTSVLADNPEITQKISGEKILGVLPYTKDKNSLYRAFMPAGDKILLQIKKT